MADTAAHLVDWVIPEVPVRQWVLSLPFALRYRVAFDGALLGKVLGIFARAVFRSLRRRARDYGIPRGQCGAVTFIQRFGSALNLTPHLHMLTLDGVYAAKDGEAPRFYPLRAPEKSDVMAVAVRVAEQVGSLMERMMEAQDRDGEEVSDEPALGTLYSASIQGRIATGPNAGKRVRTLGRNIGAEDSGEEESFQSGTSRCAAVSGFSAHAGVAIRAHDRKALERLCKYAARPPVATERLAQRADGRLSYRLKTPWRDGTTHVIFEPQELMEKLAVLVPAPRLNLTRFHGILAPAAKWRASVVPAPAATQSEPPCDCENGAGAKTPRRNYAWALLMARVFEVDVLECPDCKGRLRILAAIHPPENTRKILDCLDLPTRAPPLKPAAALPNRDQY